MVFQRKRDLYLRSIRRSTGAGVRPDDQGIPRNTLKNLFDERQKDLDNNGEDRDVTYFYGPNRPRSYYATLSGEF